MTDDIEKIINPEGKKTITPTEVLEIRKKLVNRFGSKISGKPKSSWTAEETAANAYYKALTEALYQSAPGTKTPDKILQIYERNEVDNAFHLLWKYAVKFFWVIFAIVILLALLKFILH